MWVGVLAAGCIGMLVLPGIARAAQDAHAPITIASDTDFASCGCVVSGAGTTSNPYVIGPLTISNGPGVAVLIDGTNLTKSFILNNLTIAGNGSQTSRGIVLRNINGISAAVTGKQTSIQTTEIGVSVLNSSNVVLNGGGDNAKGPGISSTGAGTINKNFGGAIDVENSSNVTIHGWQLSANGSDNSPDWVGLSPDVSYWGVGGIRLYNTTHSTIYNNAANNDTDVSFSLFHSSNDTVRANTADYPFTSNVMVADGSTNDTITGNDLGTADFIGVLIADPLPGTPAFTTYGATHDISVSNNFDHSDGPTGNEIRAGIAPSFSGGIVILNGTYNNTVTNNNIIVRASLVWAQEVLNSLSPIGVNALPDVNHCNVIASEGGGGVGNLNGNVWTGNVGNGATAIDSCIPPQ